MRPAPERPKQSGAWRRRSALSRLLRVAIYATPIAAGILTSLILSRLLPRPRGVAEIVFWYVFISAAMLAVVLTIERAARRLLPLAALLNLSLIFPDKAPKRFAVARRVGRPQDLRRQLQEARDNEVAGAEVTSMETVLELAAALSVHDKQTRGHSERVRVFTDLIAEEMALSGDDRARLRWASLLHDVGKLLVPGEVLRKPSALDDEEWKAIRRHPDEGARLIAPLRPWLGVWAAAVEHHHERWDGKGYPRGLAGEKISLGGRIVGLADSFETMTAVRPYRRAMSVAAAREELVRCSGEQFDPAVVRAFLNVSVGRLWRVVGVSAWIAQLPMLVAWLGRSAAQLGTLAITGATALGLGLIATPNVSAAPSATPSPPPAVAALPTNGSAPTVQSPPPRGVPSAGTASRPRSGPTSTPPPSALPTAAPQSPGAGPTPAPAPAPAPAPGKGLVVSMPAPATIKEATNYSAGGSFSDPGGQGWTATVNYGDGSGVQPLSLNGTSFNLSHSYADGCACNTVVIVTDSSGRTAKGTVAVAVQSPPAVVSIVPVGGPVAGKYKSTGSFTDSDPLSDTFTGTVDYGDGTGAQPLVLKGGAFKLNHAYALPGTYTVVVTITDDDGGSGTATSIIVS